VSWFQQIFSRRRRYQELSSSIQEHLEEKIEDLVEAGLSKEHATRAARQEFGNVTLMEERGRAVWQWPTLENIWADVKLALRQITKSPGFVTAVCLTLGLGIGANLTIFLILYGVLLRPLPFPQPQQLVRISRFYPVLHDTVVPAYSGTKALFLRRTSQTLASAAAYDYIPSHQNLLQGNQVIPLEAVRATSDFFHVFQMEPKMGRGFLAGDMLPNAPGVAVISDATWRQQFAGDPNILGRSITLGDGIYSIVGVADPHFRLDTRVDVWVPLAIAESPEDQSNMYNFTGRLKPDVTRAQAQDDLRRGLLQFKNTYPALWDRYESVLVADLHDSLVGQMRPALEILMGAVGLVMVMVSANILSLLLARSIARRREMALRTALGAPAWRILRQLLVENLLLCILGGVLGVLLAAFATPALLHLSPLPLPQFANLHLGATALLFAGGLALVCASLFSFVPTLESRRMQLNDALRMNSAQVAGGRNLPQKFLVVGEVAISLVLLVAAGLLLTSFWRLVHISPGFATTNVLTFKSSFTHQQGVTGAALGQRLDDLTARLEALPGVEAAAAVNTLPTQITPTMPFDILGKPAGSPDASGSEDYVPITAHYFQALRIPIVSGRSFSPSDGPDTQPVVIINEQLARAYFKGQNPVGQHLRIGVAMGPDFQDKVREVVGVVGDTRNSGLDAPAPAIVYLPQAQIPDREAQMQMGLLGISWVVHTKAQVDVATAAQRIFTNDARTPLLAVQSMPEVISHSMAQQRFTMILLGCFGLISLLMGTAGLYGVMSYTVARRTREIGVRMAIGASRANILRMVLREAGLLVVLGLTAGLAASLLAAQFMRSLLFAVSPYDPFTFTAMGFLLLLTGLMAAWWPARRAASSEPMQTLRME
jgi:predicted permease